MNISMFGQKKIPSRSGGVEIVVGELCTRMVKLGHSVKCYNRSENISYWVKSKLTNNKAYKGVDCFNVLTMNFKGLAAMTSSFFAAIRSSFDNSEVVHIHAEGPAFMSWLPKLLRKRVIVTIHGLDHQRQKWGKFASWYIRQGEKNAVKYADEIVVLSCEMQRYFWENYHRSTHYIPNGVSKHRITKADSITSEWGLRKDDYILFVGRLVPEKGIHYLIEAYKKISTEKKLVIVGESSNTDEYVKRLKETANTNTLFLGFQTGKKLMELFSNAYIYCLPSDLEGMPLSLLEGMSYGNCCVVSDIAECTEVVEDNAVVFRKSDVSDLTCKLDRLVSHPDEVTKYKDNAADFICSKYNWDDVVGKTLELYK